MTGPIPSWNKVRLTGKYADAKGNALSGRILFTPSVRVADVTDRVMVVPATFEAVLDVNGAFAVDLPATDDPDIVPSGFTYSVVEDFTGGETYSIELSVTAPPEGIDLTIAARAVPIPAVVTYVTFAQLHQALATGDLTGPQGASAYDVAVFNGYIGSQENWLLSLEGAKGDQGIQGEQGIQGIQGIQGDPGLPGTDGKTVLSTSGVPSNAVGVDGDYANDVTNSVMYGPKAGGVWPAGVSYKGAAGAGGSTDVQTFTASGTWNKPAGAKSVSVVVFAAGGGGGSGGRGATAAARCGGGGGGAGGRSEATLLPAATLPATVAVTVGTPGVGGAGATVDGATGTAASGTAVTASSSFGTLLKSIGGGPGSGGGASGVAGSAGSNGNGDFSGQSGQPSTSTGAAATTPAHGVFTPGGAAGGGITTGNVATNGAGGGSTYALAVNAAGGVAPGGAGADGESLPIGIPRSGNGGGGGAGGSGAASGTAGGAGGNGGRYGGGGGGGGGSTNGSASGKGGDGGPGIVVVTTYF